MIKRSAILLLFLFVGSFSLLLFASYNTAAQLSPTQEKQNPVKCSGPCNKKTNPPVPWNFISPAMFHHQG
ncbi:MAG: hypothetical protein V4685_02580 [Bacteroidota bacterium]